MWQKRDPPTLSIRDEDASCKDSTTAPPPRTRSSPGPPCSKACWSGRSRGARSKPRKREEARGRWVSRSRTYFGIPPNAISAADFPGAGIELKVVPLVRSERGVRVKERTFVSLIDYEALARETWDTASVRKKLKILFVFFEHLHGRSKKQFPIHSVVLWEPLDEIEQQIRSDWERVHAKVLAGLAHELSEGDGRTLGPSTKGADSSVLRRQPYSEELAKSRAFALKPSFTFGLYVEPPTPFEAEELAENARPHRTPKGLPAIREPNDRRGRTRASDPSKQVEESCGECRSQRRQRSLSYVGD